MASHPKRPALQKAGVRDTDSKRVSMRSKERAVFIRELIWDIFAISNHLSAVRRVWSDMLGVTGPQWLILMAVDYLDIGNGVSVGTVSTKLHVNQTFIVAQTKILEAAGFVLRNSSKVDARVVLLSLSDSARQELTKMAPQRREINNYIFSQLDDQTMKDLSGTMSIVRDHLEQAALMLRSESERNEIAVAASSKSQALRSIRARKLV